MSHPPPNKKNPKTNKKPKRNKRKPKQNQNKQKQEIRTCISKQKNLANSLLVTYLM